MQQRSSCGQLGPLTLGKLDKWGNWDNRGTLNGQTHSSMSCFLSMQTGNTLETEAPPELNSLRTSPSTRAPARARTGKIARLPDEIREIVNTMLHDAAPYAAIISRLAELGYTGFLKQNISQWRNGGYQDWRRER